MPLTAVADHVAVAVPSIDAAAVRWRDTLGGGWVAPRFPADEAGFATRQLRYPGGAKLELLEPTRPGSFAGQFLDRFGARIHHVTLKVPSLLPAVDLLRDNGLDVVDVFAEGEVWHEAFLRPSQVGGIIVQIAWAGRSDEEWAALAGVAPEPPRQDAPRLLGPTLAHPQPRAMASLWRLLGAEVAGDDDGLRVTWPQTALDLEIVPGETPGPAGLRFAGTPSHPGDATVGAPTVAVT